MKVWIVIKDGRIIEQVLGEPRFSVETEDAVIVQAPRLGDLASELFDLETKDWIPNPDHAAFIVDFDLGPDHKAKAHLQKVMEAKLLQAGIEIDGLLKKESETLGVNIEALAGEVLAHNAKFEVIEISRREIKKGIVK
jgi:hypothetical protein